MNGSELMEAIWAFLRAHPRDYVRLVIVDHPEHPELKRFPGLEWVTVPRIDEDDNLYDSTRVVWPWLRYQHESGHYAIDFAGAKPTSTGDGDRLGGWFPTEFVRHVAYERLHAMDLGRIMGQVEASCRALGYSAPEVMLEFAKAGESAATILLDTISFLADLRGLDPGDHAQVTRMLQEELGLEVDAHDTP